jgi:hypothetical protein
VTSSRAPARSWGLTRRAQASTMVSGSGSRPSPTAPQASSPAPGSITEKPRARRRSRFSCTTGLFHISTFMAGQTSTGAVAASITVLSKSSPRPAASLPRRLAVAGANTMASTSCPKATCSRGSLPGPNRAAATFSPVRA